MERRARAETHGSFVKALYESLYRKQGKDFIIRKPLETKAPKIQMASA